jgi:DNA-directed RNA polymerase subunit RPC12/RpoP
MSETKGSPVIRCQKCGGRMFQDQEDESELRCFNCGAVRYVRHKPDPWEPLRRTIHNGRRID